MTEPHPDDIDGPNKVTMGGIEWTICVDERIAPNSIVLVNEEWLNRPPTGWAWMGQSDYD